MLRAPTDHDDARRDAPGSAAATGDVVATDLLTEFLGVVASSPEPSVALEAAVRHAATALRADAVAVVCQDRIQARTGFADDADDALAEVIRAGDADIELPGQVRARATAILLEGTRTGHLVFARAGETGFTADETHLARGIGRAIQLTSEMLRTLDGERRLRAHSEQQAFENAQLLASLRERQRLLEELSLIQRMISRREPLGDILDAITRGARTLLATDAVVLCRSNGIGLQAVSRSGGSDELADWLSAQPVPESVNPGRAMLPTKTVHTHRFSADEPPAHIGTRSAITTPVHENGMVVGSLIAASNHEGREFTPTEHAMLLSFAEHASLAVTDANTLEAMYRAFHDSLTGLASRALFLDRLQHELAQAGRSGTDLTLLFIDLDRFKMVNDTLGHSAGDILLMEVANRLRACLRVSDTAARFGGDEFVVLLHDTSVAGAQVVADRIIRAVRTPFTLSGMEVAVDASIGIAASEAGSVGADELLRNADVAMYRAKRGGHGRYAAYEPSMHAALVERLQLEAELRGALDRGELVLHYQPIVSLASGDIRGVEALLRWNHPRRGLLTAADFVPIAEECGEIVPIGTWVLHAACEQARQWQTVDPERRTGAHGEQEPLTVSVNVSARQLEHADFPVALMAALDASELPASCLVLDITEGLILRDEPWMPARLEELELLGVRLAIDDFGAQYSSLAELPRLPLDIVKIDKAFVDAIGKPEGRVFARKIIELAHTLDLEVIAEGVQTYEEFAELRKARCELGQGYYFAQPLAGPALPHLRPGLSQELAATWRRPRLRAGRI